MANEDYLEFLKLEIIHAIDKGNIEKKRITLKMDKKQYAKIIKDTIIPGSVTAQELNRIVLPIRQAIEDIKPEKLYRYRTVNDNNIDSLLSDSIYTVTASEFNDPYDSLIQYNLDYIEKIIMGTANIDFMVQLRELIKSNKLNIDNINLFPNGELKQASENLVNADFSDEEEISQTLELFARNIVAFIRIIAPVACEQIRNSITYACFSENVDSITMWSHYADYHRGFAIGYSRDVLSYEALNTINCGLFPVIYDNIRYDANSLFAWAIYNILGIKMIEPDRLANIKAALHKSTDWSYEYEWMLICTVPKSERKFPNATPVKIIPNEIYYGTRISKEDKIRLHKIVESKNLSEYDMDIDSASNDYKMVIRPAVF